MNSVNQEKPLVFQDALRASLRDLRRCPSGVLKCVFLNSK